MEKLEFRLLRADEIDCRISIVKATGLSLLLYKDARVDQNILDETVGPMNWQRRHCRDNANCLVSIWDEEKGHWIEKEDTGTESYTEKEKGLASDSFKRACFNWGIGRELYTAPFIWINADDCAIKETTDRQGNKKYTCYDNFHVTEIGYDDNRNINNLVIKHNKTRKVVYKLGQVTEEPQDEPSSAPKVKEEHVNTLYQELSRTGISWRSLCKNYGVGAMKDLTIDHFRDAMETLKEKPDKQPDPSTIPKDTPEEGLPWNTPKR